MSVRTLGDLAALLDAHGAEAAIYRHAGRWTVKLGPVQVAHPDLGAAMDAACHALLETPVAWLTAVEVRR